MALPLAEVNVVHAGFRLRFWALLVDLVLATVVPLGPLFVWYGPGYLAEDRWIHGPVDVVVGWLLPVAAVLAFWIVRGGSPGKMLLSLRIRDRSGAAATARQCVVRLLGYVPSAAAAGLGFLAVAVDRNRRGWHDRLAGTVVVDEVATRIRPAAPALPWPADAGPAAPPDPSPRTLAALRVLGAVLAAYVAVAAVWAFGQPYVISGRTLQYLGPLAPLRLHLERLGLAGLLVAAVVSLVLMARAWDRAAARQAVFGLLLTLLPHELLTALAVPPAVVDAVNWAATAAGLAALWRFAALFPRPLTADAFPRAWRPPGALRRAARALANAARRARRRRPVAWSEGDGAWGLPARIGPFRRPLRLDAAFAWTAVLCGGAVAAVLDARQLTRPAAYVFVFGGVAAALAAVGLVRRAYRHASPGDRRSILWVAQGATLWIAIPMFAFAVGTAGAMVTDIMGSDVDFARRAGFVAAMLSRELGQLILPASLALAILYGGAFDPQFIIRRTALYGLVGITALGIFSGVEYLVETQVARLISFPPAWSGWIAGAASATVVGPLQAAVKKRSERLFDRVLGSPPNRAGASAGAGHAAPADPS